MTMEQSNRLRKPYIKQYALGGNATITLQSGISGIHFTYKIVRNKNMNSLYKVYLLNGNNNYDDYRYVACYYSDTEQLHVVSPYKDRLHCSWPKSMRAIKLFFDTIDNTQDNLLVYHEGRCAVCGKKLTTPESLKIGMGQKCAEHKGV